MLTYRVEFFWEQDGWACSHVSWVKAQTRRIARRKAKRVFKSDIACGNVFITVVPQVLSTRTERSL